VLAYLIFVLLLTLHRSYFAFACKLSNTILQRVKCQSKSRRSDNHLSPYIHLLVKASIQPYHYAYMNYTRKYHRK